MADRRKKRITADPARAVWIREEILREWRGGDEADDLGAHTSAAGKFVNAVLRAAGADEGLQEDQVRAAWKEVAGDFISRHAEPVSVKGGNLVLRVTQPAMRFHLEQMKPMLLERIQGHFGRDQIKSVKFTLG